ncbi:hypothetical protein TRFO_42122 [Tritrichomonas foetus]|uniref:Uncharacterized protein n=1 Tax=Tritrichomonas foetus TaxID=1144522 RepID=A0A1J4KXN7_9EUKA|nr:hypothetical protein TRFO_42122 [Tritrichomonas foetus]|eukprot:OHT15999.1 hypothetical protein TRFO_42122 [Tritrichomonas foetus]
MKDKIQCENYEFIYTLKKMNGHLSYEKVNQLYMNVEEAKKLDHEIENIFKMGKVLVIRNELDMALSKFIDACKKFQDLVLNQEKIPARYEFLSNSLYEIGEIYSKKKIIDKSLQFHSLRRKFLEFFVARPETQYMGPQLLTIPAVDCPQRKEIVALFGEMNDHIISPTTSMTEDEREKIVEQFREQCRVEKKKEMQESARIFREVAKQRREAKQKSISDRIIKFLDDPKHMFYTLVLIGLFVISIPISYSVYLKKTRKPINSGIYSNSLPKSNHNHIHSHDIGQSYNEKEELKKSEQFLSDYMEKTLQKVRNNRPERNERNFHDIL